jgi:two-component system, chemotaxis family, sensor kinase CheA
MYIEDAELRDIYKSATIERLQTLEASLLHLEKHPSDRAQLEAFLREAHTLKGDSRMLGVKDVETLTHHIEDLMAAVKRGERVITADMCDRIYQGIDAIRKLVREAVTGEKSGVNVFLVMAQLMGAQSNESELAKENVFVKENGSNHFEEFSSFDESLFSETESKPQLVALPEIKSAPSSEITKASSSVKAEEENVNTIRVEASKLDVLMRQAGELNIAKLRVARRTLDMEELLRLYEEWSRDNSINYSLLKQFPSNSENLDLKQVNDFWKRNELRLEKLGNLVSEIKAAAYEDATSLESITNELESGIQNLRLLPLSTIFNLFPRMVRDLAKQQGKQVKLELEGGQTRVDKRIVEEMKDSLLHILRNAIDHGIETLQERESKGKSGRALLRLRGYQSGDNTVIEIIDDGRGLDVEAIKRTAVKRGVVSKEELAQMSVAQIQSLIFAPGFSTRTEVTELSGRGIGLDVVRTNVERLKGNIQVESIPGKGCEFRLRLSANLATTDVLITEVTQIPYAVPLEFVEQMMLISRQEIFALEGSQTIAFNGQPVSVVWLADILELSVNAPSSPKAVNSAAKIIPCIMLKIGTERLGLLVDELRDRIEIVLKPQSKLLKRIRNISGATILGDGRVCMVVNPQDFLNSIRQGKGAIATKTTETKTNYKLLLVEDSIIIRTQMKRLLEGAGYDVTIAVDGLEGFKKLKSGHFDAVVSDVEMPNMSGLQLTAKIRQFSEYQELPIILVTTLASDEDKRRGVDAGANAYLTKGDFDQKILIETLNRLI